MIYMSNFIKGYYHNIEKMTSQIFGPNRSKRPKSEPNPTLPSGIFNSGFLIKSAFFIAHHRGNEED